jgi:hypothetical protein
VKPGRRRSLLGGAVLLAAPGVALRAAGHAPAAAPTLGLDETDPEPVWRARFERDVTRRWTVPAAEQACYIERLHAALACAGHDAEQPQALLLVDRHPQVQAIFVLWRLPGRPWSWLGAAPVSTGQVGAFDHFRTPLGVFLHGPATPDFRAEGTFNAQGIRGYGARGLRVFDFGWVLAERGWGRGGWSPMRLQMHATDPQVLEPRLGRPASKGCIRISTALNRFIDRHGLLDADYEAAHAAGLRQWILRGDRETLPWPGRWLVVVDSGRNERPDWARLEPVQA